MARTQYALVLLAATGLACGGKVGGGPTTAGEDVETYVDSSGVSYIANEVIIRLAPTSEDAALATALAELGATTLSVDSPLSQYGFVRLQLPADVKPDEAIDRLHRSGAAAVAERHYLASATVTPNDPQYSGLWGLEKIGAPNAWTQSTGDRSMVVAVIDSGIDLDHEDLVANLWTNPGEIPGNGRDDDGNGYIDDVHGYDFVNRDANPDDDNGHGSHCAGTIGGVGDNGIGVAGVNWNVSLMGLKVLNSHGNGSLWGLSEAILYAAEMDVRVASASLGCDGCNVSYVREALDTFEASGGLFIAAAGNNGKDNDRSPHYPSSHTQAAVVSVAATGSDDRLAGFSNYGAQSVDLAAPGVGIVSTTPGNNYASFQGTSMATPHVAGAVALYWSQHPEADAATVKERLLSTAAPLSSLLGRMQSSARLDVAALMLSDDQPPPAPADLVARVGARSDVDLTWAPVESEDLAGYRIRWGTASGAYPTSLDVLASQTSTRVTGLIEGQRYYFVVHAFDDQGNHSPASNEVLADPSDTSAPPAVVDLAAAPVPGPIVSTQVVAASGEYSAHYAADQAVDGSPDTAWISPRRSEPHEEFLVLALGQPGEVSEVELRAPPAFPDFFPIGFDVEVSANGADWTPVAGRRHQTVPADWLSVRFADTLASHVRIRVVDTYEHRSGHSYAGLAEVRVRGPVVAADSLRISFTAPGDDPGEGTALRYDLRVSEDPLTEANFDQASAVAAPTPRASGVPIEHVVSGLTPETTYYVAMRAEDDAGNRSPLSNVAVAATMVVPPGAVTDLAVAEVVANEVRLTFSASGDDGRSGIADRYDLRYALNPITAASFAEATPVFGLPAPQAPGTAETVTVIGLDVGQYYYFALRVIDGQGHESALSNVVGALTEDGVDDRPPARVEDLTVFLSQANVPLVAAVHADSGARPSAPASHLLDGDTTSVWQAPDAAENAEAWVALDLGGVHAVSQFALHPGLSGLHLAEFPADVEIEGSVDAASWTRLGGRTDLAAADATWVTLAVPVAHVRYLRLYVSRRGLGACRPDQPSCGRPVTLSEVRVRGLTPDVDADITWVAPGDDGFLGIASNYDLRTSVAPLTPGNFASATPITLPAPQAGGLLELHLLPQLAPEETHYFGLRSIDNAGNVSELSNIASVVTPGVPPAPVTDLRAATVEARGVTLAWTAPGDDGDQGTATAYDLRYSSERITPQTWSDAAALTGVPRPSPAGTTDNFTVSGLDADATYYFALIARDERGQASVLSNVLRVDTPDGEAPARIEDLAVSIVDPSVTQRLASTLGPSSGSYSFETEPRHLLDGDEQTIWLSPARRRAEDEVVLFDFGAATVIGRLRLRSAPAFTDLFPRRFQLEVRATSQSPWVAVLDEQSGRTAGGWEEWSLGAVSAQQARLVIAEGGVWNDEHFVALAEVEFHPPRAERLNAQLSWTAPGDDGRQGTASRYDLRRATVAITEGTFGAADVLPAPTPSSAGTLERATAGELMPDSHYCFAVRAEDEVPQAGAVGNSACIDTPTVAPDPVSDLAVTNPEATALTLQWTAPGAQADQGRASSYTMRMATARITENTWDDAVPVHGLPTPATAGTAQTHRVTGLLGQTRYYFALRATNGQGQTSGLSNSAQGTTLDEVAPTVISDLALTTDTTGAGRLRAQWTAPGDGETGTLAEYELRVSAQPLNTNNFGQATRVSVSAPRSPGQTEHASISGLAAEAGHYAAIRTRDAAGNWSAISNVAQARTRDEAPGRVTDLAVGSGSTDTALTLTWTAPGDNGHGGQASTYDVRYSTQYISTANFEQASAVPNVPVPSAAGARQSVQVAGLVRGTVYYFALKAVDDRGNVSVMSNWVSSQTSDSLPPGTVTDLTAQTDTSAGRVRLDWTAPGDDDDEGLVQQYELRYSTSPITAGNFAQATLATSQPSPLHAGTNQIWIVSALPNETQIYFALRARDDAGNWSSPSNSPSAWTLDVAPRRTTDLRQASRAATSVTLGWSAPGDDGSFGTATRYDLRWSTSPIDDGNFASAHVAPAPSPKAAGQRESVTISGLASDSAYYVALRTADERDNWSSVSNSPRVETADTRPPARISNLTVTPRSVVTSVSLSWTAPGDDGTTGIAQRYEVRRSGSPITSQSAWSAATVVIGAPRPGAAGASEVFVVYQLVGETTYYFAVRAYDEDDNAGALSNSAEGTTGPVPPARVTDLTGTAGPGRVTLTWTAPGDDAREGTAESYDLRYSTDTLTDGSFDDASRWSDVPTPAASGTQQSVTITGLTESTRYTFALKAADDVAATSPMSNVVTVTTPDLTAPAAPGALAGAAPRRTDTPLAPQSVRASSVLSEAWAVEHLTDGDEETSWASQGGASVREEWVTVDLGSSSRIDRVQVHPDLVYPELLPPELIVELSLDDRTWVEVARDQALSVTDVGWLQYGFRPRDARYVRLRSADLSSSFGARYAIIAEVRVYEAAPETGRVNLTWVAPGDDADEGTVDRYELYMARRAFNSQTLGDASPVAAVPAPLAAGMLQSVVVDALEGEADYWFGLRGIDEAGNVGALAGAIKATTSAVAPAPVTDLAGQARGLSSVELTWTAPGDDGLVGAATRYELRYAKWSVTSRSFPLATIVASPPTPLPANGQHTHVVTGLDAGTRYRFALVAYDEADTVSYLSNVAHIETQAAADVTPPAAVSNLHARAPSPGGNVVPASAVGWSAQQSPGFEASAVVDGQLDTAWSAVETSGSAGAWIRVDLGALVRVDRIRAYPSVTQTQLFPRGFTFQVSPDGLSWSQVASISNYSPTAGVPAEATFAAQECRYVEIRISDMARYTNGLYYAVMAELEVVQAAPAAGSALLTWTAPGDDGQQGQAATYDLRAGTCPYDHSAARSVSAPAPAPAGQPQRVRVSGLTPTERCFGVVTRDEAGNASPLSNAATF